MGCAASREDQEPQDPWELAASGQAKQLSRWLSLGGNPSALDRQGGRGTLLHAAASGDRVECIQVLLSKGADVNAVTKLRGSPLHAAAAHGTPAVVRALLDSGADPALKNAEGRTAIDLAEAHGNHGAAALLRQHAGRQGGAARRSAAAPAAPEDSFLRPPAPGARTPQRSSPQPGVSPRVSPGALGRQSPGLQGSGGSGDVWAPWAAQPYRAGGPSPLGHPASLPVPAARGLPPMATSQSGPAAVQLAHGRSGPTQALEAAAAAAAAAAAPAAAAAAHSAAVPRAAAVPMPTPFPTAAAAQRSRGNTPPGTPPSPGAPAAAWHADRGAGLAAAAGSIGSQDLAPRLASAPAGPGRDPPPSILLSACPSAPPATMSMLAGAMGMASWQHDSVTTAGLPSAPPPPPGSLPLHSRGHEPQTPALAAAHLGGGGGVRLQGSGIPSVQEGEEGGSAGSEGEPQEALNSAGSGHTGSSGGSHLGSGASSALANDPLLSWVNSQLSSKGAGPAPAARGVGSAASGATPDTASGGSAGPGTPAAGTVPAQQATQLAATGAATGGLQHAPTGMSGVSSNGGNMSVDIKPWEIEYADLQLQRQIGEGSFGRVYLAKWHETLVAVKLLLAVQESEGGREAALTLSSPALSNLQKECGLMARLRHPNIVQFMGVCAWPPAMVTEYCGKGSLTDVLAAARGSPQKAAQLTWARRLNMALDAAKGMLHLHKRGIVHRDLKSPNLLIDSTWRAKVADFNLSKLLDPEGTSGSTKTGTMAGANPKWLAPEVINGERSTEASDVFSFGIVLWELMSWEIPWSKVSPWSVVAQLLNGGRPALPAYEELPGGAADNAAFRPALPAYEALVRACWAQAPGERPDFAEVIKRIRSIYETVMQSPRGGAQ